MIDLILMWFKNLYLKNFQLKKSLFYAIFVALGEIYGREKIHNGRTFGRRRWKT